MNRIILLVALTAVGFCASFGSVASLATSPSYKDDHLVIHHLVHDGNITIHARHNAYGYFALLYADIMRNVLIRIQT